MEPYYFKTEGQEPDIDCIEKCKVLDSGVMIGSVACQECSHCIAKGNDQENRDWIKCDVIELATKE